MNLAESSRGVVDVVILLALSLSGVGSVKLTELVKLVDGGDVVSRPLGEVESVKLVDAGNVVSLPLRGVESVKLAEFVARNQ